MIAPILTSPGAALIGSPGAPAISAGTVIRVVGVALVVALAASLGLVAFKPPLQLPRIEIAQYWHERFHRDAAHRWLRAMTFELFGRH